MFQSQIATTLLVFHYQLVLQTIYIKKNNNKLKLKLKKIKVKFININVGCPKTNSFCIRFTLKNVVSSKIKTNLCKVKLYQFNLNEKFIILS